MRLMVLLFYRLLLLVAYGPLLFFALGLALGAIFDPEAKPLNEDTVFVIAGAVFWAAGGHFFLRWSFGRYLEP